jgi:hypothetical protein
MTGREADPVQQQQHETWRGSRRRPAATYAHLAAVQELLIAMKLAGGRARA